ncbi:hypothetical protein QBC44DRAFT_102594 [Cladorrhinum sp. PSN332]|nr:hypothetical protein QBC44DRAFT_102594 [Cladorrhinum sp. PSN332]
MRAHHLLRFWFRCNVGFAGAWDNAGLHSSHRCGANFRRTDFVGLLGAKAKKALVLLYAGWSFWLCCLVFFGSWLCRCFFFLSQMETGMDGFCLVVVCVFILLLFFFSILCYVCFYHTLFFICLALRFVSLLLCDDNLCVFFKNKKNSSYFYPSCCCCLDLSKQSSIPLLSPKSIAYSPTKYLGDT